MNDKLAGNTAVYLVESAKGLVSIYGLPFPAERQIVILLGQFALPDQSLNEHAEIFAVRDSSQAALREACAFILRHAQGRIDLICTDDTFNEASFRIHRLLRACHPRLTLFDHLRFAGLSYVPKMSLKALVKFRWQILKHPFAFRPIVFSNSVPGYKLALDFDRVDYFDAAHASQLKKTRTDASLILLIPLHYSRAYTPYLEKVESLLRQAVESQAPRCGPELLSRIACKLHPRQTESDRQLLSAYPLLSSCAQLDSSKPLEFFDLAGATIINLDSSFGNLAQADVLLLARHFGYTNQERSNMTGRECGQLSELQRLIDHACTPSA